MTVCPKCKGKAEYFKEVFNDGKRRREILIKCNKCNGTGEVQMTNEEWFCGLSTEEKVTALLDLRERIRQKMRGEIGSENKFYKGDYYREWLREEHYESV